MNEDNAVSERTLGASLVRESGVYLALLVVATLVGVAASMLVPVPFLSQLVATAVAVVVMNTGHAVYSTSKNYNSQ